MSVNPEIQAMIDEIERRRPFIDDLMAAYRKAHRTRPIWRRFRAGWRAFVHEVVG